MRVDLRVRAGVRMLSSAWILTIRVRLNTRGLEAAAGRVVVDVDESDDLAVAVLSLGRDHDLHGLARFDNQSPVRYEQNQQPAANAV